MEPNTTVPSASGTYPTTVEQQRLPLSPAHAETHLSPPPLLPQPSSPGLMSEWFSSSMSPAMEEHAMSQPLLSPSFPSLGEVHMTGGDLFHQPEAPAATDIPALLGSQQQWQSDMPLLSLPSGSGLPPASIDGSGGVGGLAITSSEYDLAPLPESLRIPPSMEEATMYEYDISSTTIDGSLMVPWTCGSSSSMGVVGSSSMSAAQDLTVMGAPTLPMTPAQSFQGDGSFSQQDMTIGASMLPMTASLPQGGYGSFMSSQQDLTMVTPMLPMTSPVSQLVPSSNFVQPTMDAEATPASASLQAPVLLPVKEEPVDGTATQQEPVFISLDEEEDDQVDQDAVVLQPMLLPDNSATGSVQSLMPKLKLLEQLYNIRSMSTMGASRSSMMTHISLSSSTWAGASSTLSSSTWASASSTLSSSTWTSASSTVLASTWASASSTLLSPVRATASSTLSLSSRAVDSSRQVAHINVNGVMFTDAEMEILRKDKNMQELVTTDAKKAKRTIASRICSARRAALKEKQTQDLERQAEELQTKWKEVSIQLQLGEMQCAELKENNRKMSKLVEELERQDMLKDALTEALRAQIQTLRINVQHNKQTLE